MTSKARNLRKESTPAEIKLWQHLRARRFYGLKFRRQYPIGPYVVDFVCLSKKLVIEADGSQHLQQVVYDKQRTEYFEYFGFQVIRFWNHDLLFRLDAVLEKIRLTSEEITSF